MSTAVLQPNPISSAALLDSIRNIHRNKDESLQETTASITSNDDSANHASNESINPNSEQETSQTLFVSQNDAVSTNDTNIHTVAIATSTGEDIPSTIPEEAAATCTPLLPEEPQQEPPQLLSQSDSTIEMGGVPMESSKSSSSLSKATCANAIVSYDPNILTSPTITSTSTATVTTTSTTTAIVVAPTTAPSYTIPSTSDNVPYKGIPNLGNTCYLNSALQMLMSIDGFVDDLISSYEQEQNPTRIETADMNEHQELVMEDGYEDVAQMVEYEKANVGTKLELERPLEDEVVDTNKDETMVVEEVEKVDVEQKKKEKYPLRDALAEFFLSMKQPSTTSSDSSISNLKKTIDGMTHLFVGYLQQDSHEFLSTVLDLLHDEIVAEEICTEGNEETKKDEVKEEAKDEVDDKARHEVEEEVNENLGNVDADADTVDEWATADETPNTEHVKPMDDSSPQPEEDGEMNPTKDDEKFIVVDYKHTFPSPATEKNDAKKFKVSSPPRASTMSRAPSFSELNFSGIDILLHGESSESLENQQLKGFELETPRMNCCKLIGGRIASPSSEPSVCCQQSQSNDTLVGDDVNQNTVIDDTIHEAKECDEGEENEADTSSSTTVKKPLWTDNIVDNYFTMEVRTHLTCDSCKYTRSNEEIFRHLSIDIGPSDDDNDDNLAIGDSPNVQEGIRKFFAPEKLELKCEKCFCESAVRTNEITKLPQAIIVHLKRFIVDVSPCYTRVNYRKNRAAIDFGQCIPCNGDNHHGVFEEFLATDVSYPEKKATHDNVEMENDVESQSFDAMSIESEEDYVDVHRKHTGYNIRSVVNHLGNTAVSGHYTANALRLYDDHSGEEDASISSSSSSSNKQKFKWTRFNDSLVTLMTESEATSERAQETAYMIMYEFGNIDLNKSC